MNAAIEAAHTQGVLTSASLMMGEAATADAIARARRLPDLKVGLHLALIEANPISAREAIPGLIGQDGRFPSAMVRAGFRFFFLPQIRAQLAREIRAQFSLFAATGLPLDHVNTHKHIHLHPTVARLILDIGQEFGLKAMRIPYEPHGPIAAATGGPAAAGFGDAALRLWTRQLRAAVRKRGLVANDQVFGLAWSGAMDEEKLLALIPHLPNGVSEIYFHPATTLTPGLAQTMPTYHHADELAALISPRVKESLAANGIARTSFTDLALAASGR